jgi:quaternary ammonium compound-resistance protein SugE
MSGGWAWTLLLIAGALEVSWLIAMKYADGFTRLWPTVLVFVLGLTSFYLLSLSLRVIPVGTAYAVWTGIGAFGGALVGIILFNEPRDVWRILSILLVLSGIIALKVTGPGAGH